METQHSNFVGPSLREQVVCALTDYFSAVTVDDASTQMYCETQDSNWELGYDGCGGTWRVEFKQLRATGRGEGEFAVHTACVGVDPALECLLTFHVRFVLYKNGAAHAHYHYDPECPPAAFDWGGPFTVIAGDGVLHIFERMLYNEMYSPSMRLRS